MASHVNDGASTVLRVKRKRESTPYDELIVEAGAGALIKRPPMDELSRVMAGLAQAVAEEGVRSARASLPAAPAPTKRVRFRRLATVPEAEVWSKTLADKLREKRTRPTQEAAQAVDLPSISRAKAAAQAELRTKAARSRASARRRAQLDSAGSEEMNLRQSFRIFDVLADDASSSVPGFRLIQRRMQFYRAHADTVEADRRARFVPLSAPSPGRILNPFQRQLDEAIWRAFATADLAPVFDALRGGADVNYQRMHSDLTTALMAAAFHGDARAVVALLRQGALARIADISGRSASRIASERGHVSLAALLRDVQHEEEEEFSVAVSGRPAATKTTDTAVGCTSEAEEFDVDVFVAADVSDGEAEEMDAAATVGEPASLPTAAKDVSESGAELARQPQLLMLDELSLAALWGHGGEGALADTDLDAWEDGPG